MDKIERIEKLQRLREVNALTEDEFQKQKRLVLEDDVVLVDLDDVGLSPDALAEFEDRPSDPDDYYDGDEAKTFWRPKWIILGLVLAVAAVFAAWAYSSAVGTETIRVEVTGQANVRSAPNAENSEIIEQYEPGTELSGRWVDGQQQADGKWFEFRSDGRTLYIWGGNLSEIAQDQDLGDETDASNDIAGTEDAIDEIPQGLSVNAPSLEIREKYNYMGDLGTTTSQYLVNVGERTENINYLTINGRSEPLCTIWPVYGYDYDWYPGRAQQFEKKEGSNLKLKYIGLTKQELLEAGVEVANGIYQYNMQVGDEMRIKMPRDCGSLVMLDVSTDFGVYRLNFR